MVYSKYSTMSSEVRPELSGTAIWPLMDPVSQIEKPDLCVQTYLSVHTC